MFEACHKYFSICLDIDPSNKECNECYDALMSIYKPNKKEKNSIG